MHIQGKKFATEESEVAFIEDQTGEAIAWDLLGLRIS